MTENLVEQLRIVKDKERDRCHARCLRSRPTRAFDVVRAELTTSMTELEVAAELEYQARRFGAKALSFPAIVAVGDRVPRCRTLGQPTARLGESDFTLIDWGVNSGLYMSDLTRIIVTGKISPKLRKIYGVVLKAQLAAIDAIRPGKTCEESTRRTENHHASGLRQSIRPWLGARHRLGDPRSASVGRRAKNQATSRE